VNLERGRISGCEALLRWNHPRRGWVPPADFIPVAEATGLIVPIGEWVLQRACADAASWPSHIKVAVNLSAVQFRSRNIVDTIAASLRRSGLAPGRLELEITETILLADSPATLQTLHDLKALGARISMDDFGTGYSSLSYLRSFPFDKIKIDGCFIRDMRKSDPSSRVITRAVARLGNSLCIATLAECIETQEQAEIARAEGCIEGQGYFFGRPQPAAELAPLLWSEATASHDGDPEQESLPVASPLADADPRQIEERRIQALYELQILDTPAEEAFDRITRLARLILQAPMAAITLVDRDRQWFKSRLGLDIEESPRHFSFCTHTIGQDTPFVVPDAAADPRFANSPLVKFGPGIRFYAGVPLRTASGYKVGALCVKDVVPRQPTQEQLTILQDLAGLVVDELELRRIARTDSTTGALTARGFYPLANRRLQQAREAGKDLCCIVLDIDGFKHINHSNGHAMGDRVLAAVAELCRTQLDTPDLLVRLSGDEFAILLVDSDIEGATAKAEAIRAGIDGCVPAGLPRTTATMGVASRRMEDGDIKDLLARADKALREAKRKGRNRVEVLTESAGSSHLAA